LGRSIRGSWFLGNCGRGQEVTLAALPHCMALGHFGQVNKMVQRGTVLEGTTGISR
jgi:hypothetical protein